MLPELPEACVEENVRIPQGKLFVVHVPLLRPQPPSPAVSLGESQRRPVSRKGKCNVARIHRGDFTEYALSQRLTPQGGRPPSPRRLEQSLRPLHPLHPPRCFRESSSSSLAGPGSGIKGKGLALESSGIPLFSCLTFSFGFFPPPPPPGGSDPPAPPLPPPAEVDGTGAEGEAEESPGFPPLAGGVEVLLVLALDFFGVLRRGADIIPPGPCEGQSRKPRGFSL